MSNAKFEGRANASVEKILDEPPVKEVPIDPAPVIYCDNVYTSRTLILPDGRAVPVAKGRIAAADTVLLEFLNQHEDFNPLE
ncbi:hypothetical protein [Pseudomonas sp. NA-150]|uniref:hypothetical protein n=1 Tax=Pseudomonas sp. NA-150 TaxID=3367525 RepID=UPI0037CBD7A7